MTYFDVDYLCKWLYLLFVHAVHIPNSDHSKVVIIIITFIIAQIFSNIVQVSEQVTSQLCP